MNHIHEVVSLRVLNAGMHLRTLCFSDRAS